MTRRLSTISSNALLAIAIALCAIWVFTFFHIVAKDFTWRGQPRHLVLRGGEIYIDNEPQRSLECTESSKVVASERQVWETRHNQLLTEMERSPYGPQYTAARLRMDAWEAINGIRWTKWPTPASPHVEHRFQLIGLLLVIAAAWIILRLRSRRRNPAGVRDHQPRRFALRAAVVLILLVIAAIWDGSYRQVLRICIYLPRSACLATASRGHVGLGLGATVDAAKYRDVEEASRRIDNNDVDFLVRAMNNAPPMAPVPVKQTVRVATKPSGFVMVNRTILVAMPSPPHLVPGISAGIVRDSALDRLSVFPSGPELQQALLEALHDPERYIAAHVLLSERFPGGFMLIKGQRIPMSAATNAWYSDSTFAGLKIVLTPEQKKVDGVNRLITPRDIVPGQMSQIELKWRRILDRPTDAVSLGWTTPLLLAPAYWILSGVRAAMRRRNPHLCPCGYNLTGNLSGICPECGSPVLRKMARLA